MVSRVIGTLKGIDRYISDVFFSGQDSGVSGEGYYPLTHPLPLTPGQLGQGDSGERLSRYN